MKCFLVKSATLAIAAALLTGCGKMDVSKKTETMTSPTGTTTTTDEHKVESSGSNPPANSEGEKAVK